MRIEKPEVTHFNQKPRRKAEFITPANTLRTKVGYGGLGDEILIKAQAVLEHNTVDFQPLAEMYLASMMRGIEYAGNHPAGVDNETLIAGMLYPAEQLKSTGGIFRYPLVTRISDKLLQFLEVIAKPDEDAIEIVLAFHTTIRAVLMGRVGGTGGKYGDALMRALEDACLRYFAHYPANRSAIENNYTTQF
jgi:hypothetical protein